MNSVPITVASSVDAGFLPYVGPVVSSMAQFASPGRPIEYRVFYAGPESAESRVLDGYRDGPVTVRLVRPPDDFERFAGRARTGTATLIRLSAGELMPDVERVLYLDVDLLVLDDIGTVFDSNLGGHPAGAVVDYTLYCWMEEQQRGIGVSSDPLYELEGFLRDRIGLNDSNWHSYVNTGVTLMDLAALRGEGFGPRVLELIEARADALPWPDQDAINIVLRDRIALLAPRWNMAVKILERRDTTGLAPVVADGIRAQKERHSIVHFIGDTKPWMRTGYRPWSGTWWHFANRSPTAAAIHDAYRRMRLERRRPPNPLTATATMAAGLRYRRQSGRHG